MKSLRSVYFVLVFAILSFAFNSCNQDPEIHGEKIPDSTVFGKGITPENDFVWRALNSWYYWQEDVPNLRDDFRKSTQYYSLVNPKKPDALFYGLLNKFGIIDRNSWIMLNGIIKGYTASVDTKATVSTGFDFTVYQYKPGKMYALVNYVVPGTSAKQAGIKRGDLIIKVNGNPLNNSNYRQLNDKQYYVTVALDAKVVDGDITYSSERAYHLSASTNVNEDPIHFYTYYKAGNNKVAYLLYNGFESSYNSKLNFAFGWFKAEGVNELILDLRYNGGGAVNTAVALAQMITGRTDSPFVKLKFNHKHTSENTTFNMPSKISVGVGKEEKINSLGLNRVFILTSQGTASASEIIIKCLKPYIDVITIGDKTYGKYVGSFTLYDSPETDFTDSSKRNREHNWTLQPITFAYYDINETPTVLNEGMKPDHYIPYFEYVGNLDEFDYTTTLGEISDPAIRKAYDLIKGTQTLSRMSRSIPDKDFEFVASRKTMMPLGTDTYLESE